MRHLKLFESFEDFDLDQNFSNEVDSLFQEYPELERIGTKQAYSQYLETVFPQSKIKSIVYHSSPGKFSKFKDPASSGLSHIWFSEKPLDGQFGSNIYPVLIDLQNPLTEENPDYRKELESFEVPLNPDWVNNLIRLENYQDLNMMVLFVHQEWIAEEVLQLENRNRFTSWVPKQILKDLFNTSKNSLSKLFQVPWIRFNGVSISYLG